jgi:hypothetical protein
VGRASVDGLLHRVEEVFCRVHRPEAAYGLVVVARPQVVRTDAGVVPLTAVQESVRRRSGAGNRHAEGVELIRVADSPCRVG